MEKQIKDLDMNHNFEFETCTPEKLGIPSQSISLFLQRLEEKRLSMHGVIVIRHGKIAAEGYYKPFSVNRPHRLYSSSKTFVSAAIGILADQGKIHLDDKVIDCFPEYAPKDPHPFLKNVTIRNLLTMSTPYTEGCYGLKDKNWVEIFFQTQQVPSHPGGTLFSYDTAGTVVLNGIVEKVSGKELIAFLRPTLDKLGISKEIWCVARPEGGAWGGSGVVCLPHDFAKFAMLLLNKGEFGGEQLISREYMEAAASAQIDTQARMHEPEFQFGYGYQLWRTRNDSFAMVGMGSQIALCIPEKDMILVTLADTQATPLGSDAILNAFWTTIYPQVQDGKLPENTAAYDALMKKIAGLSLLKPLGKAHSEKQSLYDGVVYCFSEPNRMTLDQVSFSFEEERGTMRYTNETGEHELHFGLGKHVTGTFPETCYFDRQIGVPCGREYQCSAAGAWFDDDNLILFVNSIDNHLGTIKIHVHFSQDWVMVAMTKFAEWFFTKYDGIATGYAEKAIK